MLPNFPDFPCSTSDQTYRVTLQLFPPPREDVDLQDPSAAKFVPIYDLLSLFTAVLFLNAHVEVFNNVSSAFLFSFLFSNCFAGISGAV